MKVSIVMAYYNRKPLLLNTLKSFRQYQGMDYEVIVVDDASDEHHRLDDIEGIKVVRVDKKDKWYNNSCIPYNMGFRLVTGDVVLIQNPECIHSGNILDNVIKTINDSNYLSYACYSLPENGDRTIINKPFTSINGESCWYNHSTIRPTFYHFCSAITKKNLDDLGGFDERYSKGYNYDDDEFLVRINRKGLSLRIIDDPYVFHQWHYSSSCRDESRNNADLFYRITMNEDKIKVNE